jgi:5'-3' exonuclease
MNINFEIFLDILKNISDIEFNIINDIYNYENVNYSNVEYIQDINKLDNMNLNFNDNKIINHLGLSNYVYKKNILDLINCNITNYNNFSSNFINNYNSYYFNNLDINKVIENYIEGLFWTFFYYFKDCNNWLWFYKFNSSPLLYNIIRYIDVKLLKNIFNKISINHYNKGIINPYEQLCIILPSNLHYLINDKYKTVINKYLPYYYKDEIKIDFFNKNKLW